MRSTSGILALVLLLLVGLLFHLAGGLEGTGPPAVLQKISKGWELLGEEFPAPVLDQFSEQKGHFDRH